MNNAEFKRHLKELLHGNQQAEEHPSNSEPSKPPAGKPARKEAAQARKSIRKK